MKKPIYLDYAATTPVDPKVAAKMLQYLTHEGIYANPASLHELGQEAFAAVETAREQVAALIHADPREIIWTSGATEADNLAIKGAAAMYQRRGKHIITMQTEHKAVLDTCQTLEKSGYQVRYLKPQPSGLLNLAELETAIRQDTILVSIMYVNNETGVIQDIKAISKLLEKRDILLHVDAAQASGKLPLDVQATPVDLMSLCAHKTYGPKGIGALYIRRKPRVRVEPLLHGGGHEQGMRSGTLAPHQIIGMGEAFALAQKELKTDYQHALSLRTRFLSQLQTIENLKLNVNHEACVPHILNVRFEGMIADAILKMLPEIATSTASACQGKGVEGSYVLRAMGLNIEQVKSSIRFSFGRFTSLQDIDCAKDAILRLF